MSFISLAKLPSQALPNYSHTTSSKPKLSATMQIGEVDAENILTGRVITKVLPNVSSGLERNLKCAQDILKHVQNTTHFSLNYMLRSKAIQANPDKGFRNERYKAVSKIYEFMQWLTPAQKLKFAEKFNVGNCFDMALVGQHYAREKFPDIRVERFSISVKDEFEETPSFGGDHAFLVIGRKKTSAPEDYKNWGADAVICGPWEGSYFPASRLGEYLKDYVGIADVYKGLKAQVRSFDPVHQKLMLET